jgi:putative transposase
VNGRKRHLLVDTLGLLLTVVVHGAQVQDRVGAKQVLAKARQVWTRLLLVWVDGGYTGGLIDWAWATCGWFLDVVKRSDHAKGFELLPHRWIIERTLGWFGRYRRLSKDYEYRPDVSETMIYVAMVHLMVRRLVRA